MPTINYVDWTNGVDAARTQAYTNDPDAGSDIVLTMADTSRFLVGSTVTVSSSAGSENATVTVVDPNVSITVNTLALNHTTSSPLVTLVRGTNINPYKTIDTASTGLTGGDEVRCAKSAAATALTGTLTFTADSTTVNTSVDLSAEVAANDFIRPVTGGNSSLYWKVVSVSGGAKTITLTIAYRGTTATTVAGEMRRATNCHDTGAAATSTTAVQTISASGTSSASRITISGGWNLSGTPAVDGETWFYQSGGTTLNGYGLYGTGKSYLTIDKLNFLNYNYGIYIGGYPIYVDISNCIMTSAEGIYTTGSLNLISNCEATVLSTTKTSFYCYLMSGSTIVNLKYANGYGIQLDCSLDNLFDSCTCLGSSTYALYENSSFGSNWFIDCNFQGKTIYVPSYKCNDLRFYNCSNIVTITQLPPNAYSPPIINGLKFKKFNTTTNDDRAYGSYGYIKKNTAAARSGACVEVIPSSATYYLYFQRLIGVLASTDRPVTVYMKKSADWNGTVEASLWWKGEIIDGWDTWSMTTSYVAQTTLTAPAGSIDEDGILEMRFRFTGTVGSVYIDDLS